MIDRIASTDGCTDRRTDRWRDVWMDRRLVWWSVVLRINVVEKGWTAGGLELAFFSNLFDIKRK
jgi:hypothetical protein